ncbi:hypothetical protein GASC598I20_014960 [Gilliamella apicola SCGC AB-598-I20]|uniref:Uncharacterized protein n=1 Tax=Gilliamella apicola TaxID=1196095 RepID=A0A2V4E6Z5_9GAMM|nr:hypothetical protein [Gilliamella apicola]KES18024.1 hypothetical protein GASC598I20_014960 [Gilliamella apicola SCGC AB-598-I20]PXZ08343.1 hypothetical protein DKK70_02235 [Gilliamella apicola]
MNKFKLVLIILTILLFGIKQCENRQKQRADELIKKVKPLLDNPELYIKDIKTKATENSK